MKNGFFATTAGVLATISVLASCSTQEEMKPKPAPPAVATTPAPAPEAKAPAPEKAKATKLAGDVGLLDTEKNYMIIVTKEGKLVTVDFDPKTKATQITPTPGKIADIGLGSSAVVTYEKLGDKNIATNLEYKPAKGE
jgi:hypothetical protein